MRISVTTLALGGLLLSTGCPFAGPNELESIRDADGDGERALLYGGDDCDDTRADVNPDAREVWGNDVDEDCDGNADDRDEDGVADDDDCDPVDPEVLGPGTWYVDRDGDGVAGILAITDVCPTAGMESARGTDCDDDDASISPLAPELCDGLDNDCDRVADEPEDVAFVAYWPDEDEDGVGYGTSSSTCGLPPPGTAPVGGDCDDRDPARFLGNPEICDGKDNDCDPEEAVDDGLPVFTYTIDLDEDGHGADETRRLGADGLGGGPIGGEVVTCATEPPAGYAEDAADCDDADPDVVWYPQWPDADRDGYGDEAAQADLSSCSALPGHAWTGDDCDDGAAAIHPATVWYPDADADGFGDPARATPEGCLPPELPGIWLPRGGDCDDTRADVHPGAGGEAPHDGVDQDCDDETELDEDGDGIPDFRFACTSVTVEPETWPLGLQDVLDRLAQDPDGCAVIPLSTGDYGPIDVRSPVALVAVPGAEVRFASLAGGTAISATTNQPVEILLEKITFDGWDRTVDLGAGDLVASEIRVDGGEGVVVRALAGASRLTVYDAVFDAVDTVYDPLWTGTGTFGHVTFERVLVSGAVAPRSVLVGGTEGTRLQSVEIEHSAAIQTILRVPGDLLVRRPRSVVLDTVRVGDSLGRVLDLTAQDDDVVTIDGLELVGNITVDRQLLAVSTSGPRSPAQVLVTGLVALDNTMEPSGGSGIDLVSSAMFDFGGADLRMTGSTFVANDTESGWLVDGRGRIEATAFAGLGGGGGLRFAGVLAHTTLAGFGAGRNAVVVEASDPLVGLRLEDTLVADSAGRFGADVELAQVLVFGSAPSCDADPDCDLVPGDPGFLRAGSSVPPELVDLRVLPWSEAIDPGCSLGGCDVGAWTPTTAPADYASLDGDVLYDSWETTWLGTTTSGPGADPDADGLSNLDEFSAGTLPADADGDGDGTPDGLDPLPWDPSVP